MTDQSKYDLEKLALIRLSKIDKNKLSNEYLRKIWFENGFYRDPNYHYVQIKDNNLYMTYKDWGFDYESRIEGGKFLLLTLLKNYKLPDVEFIYFDSDELDTTEPVFVPSCTRGLEQLLGLSFTFCHYPEAGMEDHTSEMNKLFEISEETDFESWKNRKTQICYRGSMNNSYRNMYKNLDVFEICDFKNVELFDPPRGINRIPNDLSSNSLTRSQKASYKYLLHLNGNADTAYSSAFRYGLACKSLVFYATSNPHQEWWQLPEFFKSGEHYVEVSSPQELMEKLNFYSKNDDLAYEIASNGYEFSKKYLTRESALYYYYISILEISKNQNVFELLPDSKLIETYRKRISVESIIDLKV